MLMCKDCALWVPKEDDELKGDCHRATNTTWVSGCMEGLPKKHTTHLGTVAAKELLANPDFMAAIVEAVRQELAPSKQSPAPEGSQPAPRRTRSKRTRPSDQTQPEA